MKHFYQLAGAAFIAFVLFTSFKSDPGFCSGTTSFVSASPGKELILQVPEVNDKNLADVRSAIENAGGLTFSGYCAKNHVLMYFVDVTVHNDYAFLDTILPPMGFSYNIKEGTTIYQVETDCGLDAGPPQIGSGRQ